MIIKKKEYFDAGHGYDVILDMLSIIHNINMSLRTLKTRLFIFVCPFKNFQKMMQVYRIVG